MKYLKPYFQKYKLEYILAPLFKMLEASFDLAVPLIVAGIIDRGIAAGDRHYIFMHFALMLLMAILGVLCSFTAQYFAAKASIGTSAGMRHQLLAHIQSLSFTELDQIGTSTLITRLTSDLNQVQNGLNMFLRLFLRSPFIILGAVLLAFTIHARMALIFVIVTVVLFLIVFGIMKITNPKYKLQQQNLDRVTSATRENLTGVRVIRAFGREASETRHFEATNDVLLHSQLHVGRISAFMNPLTYVCVNTAIIVILWIGAQKVHGGLLLSGDIIALINYIGQILVELVKLANLIILLSKAAASLGRVSQVLDTAGSMTYGTASCGQNPSEILRFEHVSLRYADAGEESLSDLNFTVKAGQTVGIIGGTGSGKTSLVNLIPRFYDATSGTVYFKGRPIQDYEAAALRKTVAIVLQKAQLFSGTIRSNLLWGNQNASDDQLWDALQTAQAADFVRQKPGQLDAPVEQGGRNLSGGQKQRLCIARALTAKPEILILDDSSSALDYATDAALRKALAQLPNEMTLVIVTQRTASVRHADRILVLDDGRLVGCGKHEQLLQTCEVYRQIHESQFGKGDAR